MIPKDFVIGAEVQDDLQRLESKIDKLAEAVHRLVLVEDRQIRTNARIDKLETDMGKSFDMLRTVEKRVDTHANYGRASAAIFTAALTIIGYFK